MKMRIIQVQICNSYKNNASNKISYHQWYVGLLKSVCGTEQIISLYGRSIELAYDRCLGLLIKFHSIYQHKEIIYSVPQTDFNYLLDAHIY